MMRVEPFGVGSIVHIIQRGARGSEIVRDEADRIRTAQSFLYLNDAHVDPYWRASVSKLPLFTRPDHWPERKPLVHILGWTLLDNHFHLLIEEVRESGTAKFMQRLCGSLAMSFNRKYRERGSLFQGSYRARTVTEDAHYQYLAFYILVKNVFDMYPGGLSRAHADFGNAWEWAKQYPYSSFRNVIAGLDSPITDDPAGLLSSIIGQDDSYKKEAKELLDLHLANKGGEFTGLMLEQW